VIEVTQGSDEWRLLRCGRVGASEFGSILAKGQGKTRAAYMRRIIAERLTGKPADTFSNGHTDRGTTQEPLARLAYEARTDNIVQPGGYFPHPELMAGCSPDGLIEKDGAAEIKCVIPAVQIETLERGDYPPEHKPQIQGGLWLTGRRWWDFVSFCPDMPAHLRCHIFRVERDEPYIKALEVEVRTFLNEVEAKLKKFDAGQQDVEALLRKSLIAKAA
jgi:hypothetical protein